MKSPIQYFDLPGWKGLKLSGRVDAFIDRQVIQSIHDSISSTDRIAADLSEVEFLSLQTLKYLSNLSQSLGRSGGELALLCPNHIVRKQIEIFLGPKAFRIYSSKADLTSGYYAIPRAEFQFSLGESRRH